MEAINKSVEIWTADKVFPLSCDFAEYVCFTFCIPQSFVNCHVRMKLETMDTKFMKWVYKFVAANKIKIPHINTLFTMLIYRTMGENETYEISNDYDTLERIRKTRDSICELLKCKTDSVHGDMNEKFFDGISRIPPGDKGVLSNFEGDIYFEPMDVNPIIDNGIIIQGLQ